MKLRKQKNAMRAKQRMRCLTPQACRSPFFIKPFAGFAYVGKPYAKPRLGEQGVF